MIKDLIVDAYKKGKEALIEQGSTNPSDNAISEYISIFINEDCKIQINPRTLRNYYKDALEDPEKDISISRTDVINSLCQFIGYSNYQDYVKTKNSHPKLRASKKYNIIGLIVLISIFIVSILFFKKNEPRLMIWNNDHYEEVEFNLEKYKLSDLKVYKQERIDNFKKIEPTCDYQFFDADGTVLIWYGKNTNKDYEFFTDLGLHPETGKTLKPITDYIIEKHICP
ncbi:hypothetical protein [Winogradskyella aquimaris]|uniref:Uncharacterized protein n=1 Tax=Winogradskyella aquimaris TaxID=864074 RepID=A0ABU5EPC0_9FLAO|nr:hypothetical protein [Winogradskyella aquimaris]MDY2588192.1 hypothetical protein [Winogradskyella aquimaris]